MTSLTASMLAGLSGLRTAQVGLATASQNIANANTPGYVRAEISVAPRTQLGAGAGVEVSTIRRAADRFLTTAALTAEATRGATGVRADFLDRAQISFGDPAGATSMFASLDQFWSALTEVGVDPGSALRRADVVSALQSTYSEVRRIGAAIQDLIGEADGRIGDAVEEAQGLIDEIAKLNGEIRLSKRAGADSTGAENAQSIMIDKLATLMDVRVTPQIEGGVHVRTSGGALLVGVRSGQLDYTPSNAPYATHDVIGFNEDLGTQSNIEPFLRGGEIKGLIDVRDGDLAGLAEALGGFAGALADAINAVHNENTSSPALGALTGRRTGLLGTDALGFTGQALIGITDSSGVLRQRLSIDFDTGIITGDAPAASYTAATGDIDGFVAALDAAMAAASPPGGASFVDGQLSLNVGSGGGIVVQQDPSDPSARAGRGFAHFFGLNDAVSRPTPLFFESGVQGSDLHGLTPGGGLTYRIRDSVGRFVAERTVTISGGIAGPTSTWDNFVDELNTPGLGVGEFGAFSLDAATGKISFAASGGYQVELVADSTQRGGTSVSFTAMHGLSKAATAGRAQEVDVGAALAADPTRLAVGRPNLAAALGTRIIEAGDNRGAAALASARTATRQFPAAGVLSGQSTTLAAYAAGLGGEAGRRASEAERATKGAEAVASAAADRRAEIEGVNLDDELVRMTNFQNSYAAAARVIQAATEMLDILMTIGYR